ncbi:MAG: carboxypeptidase-like regulatory domain-containing protein [Chloroflexota bacterium]|nr:carboxypeptidase-like regulatory domain-containing protein [Acidobacteriota bacterium]MDQ3525536.1 carboxypeptidase-like regulatory domain-containing protein [Chloroflexota bacterium]
MTATSPALQGERTTVTDQNGVFVLRGLPPGL